MDYTALLKRAASLVWHNKFLWALGFLAALGGNSVSNSGGGGSNFNFPSPPASSSSPTPTTPGSGEAEFEAFIEELAQGGNPLTAMPEMVAGIVSTVFLLVCCFLIFFIVMWFVRQVAEAGMIQSVFNLEAGQQMSFGEAMSSGMDSLWRYVGVNLLLKFLPSLVFTLFVGGLALMTVGAAINEASEEAIFGAVGLMFACLLPLMCLFIPYNLWVTLVYPFAQRGITLHDLGVVDGIKHGWQTLKNNFTPIFLLGILFVAISFVTGIVMLIVYLPILGLTMLPIIFALIAEEAVGPGSMAVAGFGIFLIVIISAFVNAILVAYRSTVFTLAYSEFMDTGKVGAKSPESY